MALDAPGPESRGLAEKGEGEEAGDVEAAVESTNTWPDEAAETAFFTEARARAEPVEASPDAAARATGETDLRGLPQLDDLVERIPPEVREVLDDLFRAKFTGVKRVPQKVLKDRPPV